MTTMAASPPGDVIIVEESSSQVHEELVGTMDQTKTCIETCDLVTSDPSPRITSGTDQVSTVSIEDKTLALTPLQDSAPTPETVSSQESKVLSKEIHPETSSIILPEAAASKTRRNRLPKPKPNLSRASRTSQREPSEAVSTSVEPLSAPVKADIEAKTLQISAVKDFILEAPSQPEPEEQKSEICEERENDTAEGCSPVLSPEKNLEDGAPGRKTCIEDERKEGTLETHRYIREDLCFILFHYGFKL